MSTSRTREKADGELFKSTGIDDNATSTAVTIDANENVLVGKTTTAIGTAGSRFIPNGQIQATASSQEVLLLNRLTSDGELLNFRKDGTTVGRIGTSGSQLIVGNGNSGLRFHGTANLIHPTTAAGGTADGTIDLANGTNRFKDAYLSGGVYLGGTGAANKLDDYEEGTWTPTVASGTVSTNDCRYTKIGSMVHLMGYLSTWSDNTSSTTIDIGGLPFSSISGTAAAVGPVMPRYFNVNSAAYNMNVYLRQSTNTIRLYHSVDNGTYYIASHSDCAGPTASLRFQITYRTT